jgi:pantoate--beta-alanine ligase
MRPQSAKTAAEIRQAVREARARGLTIGFVPTMGGLHEGHLALVRRAKEKGYVVMSIFVNPTQFSPGEDYEKYPRDLERDIALAEREGVDLVFAPDANEMYPPGDSTFVEVTGSLTKGLCAPFRPGHFRGVTTVVAKLFNIVQPDKAYFGEKDFQQLQVIRRMARDLAMPVEIVGVPTVREPDGLAMSSRNAYLSLEEREASRALSQALREAQGLVKKGQTDASAILQVVRDRVSAQPLVRLQYVEVCNPETLEPVSSIEGRAVLAMAAIVGKTRLIDNIMLEAS